MRRPATPTRQPSTSTHGWRGSIEAMTNRPEPSTWLIVTGITVALGVIFLLGVGSGQQWGANQWSALGTCVGAFVAIAAAVFAGWQVLELRSTRERQAQPNVVAFTRPNAKAYSFLDLVVANYGLTPAYHVRLNLPPLTVSPDANGVAGRQITKLHLPEEIAVLAPGQEWLTMWDAATARYSHRHELGSRFTGFVTFQDSRNNSFHNPVILDWNTHFDTRYVGDSPDESAKTIAAELTKVASVLKSYKAEHEGIWVYPVPAEEERQHSQAQAPQQSAAHDHILQMLTRTQDDDAPTEDDTPTSDE
jgi:hypothetical protein